MSRTGIEGDNGMHTTGLRGAETEDMQQETVYRMDGGLSSYAIAGQGKGEKSFNVKCAYRSFQPA